MATIAQTSTTQHITQRPTLFLAFELSTKTWKLGFTTASAQRPRERSVPAREITAVQVEIAQAKQRFGLPEDAQVLSCYEAGRDGCWLHRCFVAQSVENMVVDSSSIEVQRRKRRAKTDRLEVHKLRTMLRRHHAGEQQVWSVVHVPSVADEDRRQLHRELLTSKRDRTRLIKRIKGLLASQGSLCPCRRTLRRSLRSSASGMAHPSPWGCGSALSVSGSNWPACPSVSRSWK